MARWSDIQPAFIKAIKRTPKGAPRVAVVDFLRELKAVGHDWSPNQAVEYIRMYQTTWKIHTEGEYGQHIYMKFAHGITLT
nr:DNA polymerase V [uncultured Serratia sp.]